MDGQGRIALALDNLPGYHGISDWLIVGPEADSLFAFRSNPSPRLWPQARGFQMVSTLSGYSDSSINFQTYIEGTRHAVDESIGWRKTPLSAEFDSAGDPAGGTVVAWIEPPTYSSETDRSVQVKARRYDTTGRRRFEDALLTTSLESGASSSPSGPLAVGTDTQGRTLVLWTEKDAISRRTSTKGRWLEADGTPLTPVFSPQIPLPPEHPWGLSRWTLTPLLGGGLALRVLDTWTYAFASGATQEGPLPAGLAGRQGQLERVRGGRAYALLLPAGPGECGRRVEILAPDATSCGTLTFGAERCQNASLALGAEGSILQQQELAHPVLDADGYPFNGCTLTWWPGLLR